MSVISGSKSAPATGRTGGPDGAPGQLTWNAPVYGCWHLRQRGIEHTSQSLSLLAALFLERGMALLDFGSAFLDSLCICLDTGQR